VVSRASFILFSAIVFLAPLPFASNRPWSWSLLCLLVGALLVIDGLNGKSTERLELQFLRRILPGLALWLSTALWIGIQALPIAPTFLAHPLFFEAAALIGTDSGASISVDPSASITGLMRFLAYGGVFWLAARWCTDVDRADSLLRLFVFASAAYALYGLIIYFLKLETILWFDKWAYRGDLVSTFINRNTYATFAGLGVIASIALTFQIIGKSLGGHQTYRELFRSFVDAVSSRALYPFLALLLNATALLQTHSRGGFLSTCLALFVLLLSLIYVRSFPLRFSYILLGIVALSSLFAFSMSGDIVTNRLERTTLEASIRDDVYLRITDAIATMPLTGSGYGTFEDTFAAFKTERMIGQTWDKAHNSYLELSMELGLPAAAAVFANFAWLCSVYAYGMVRRRRHKMFAVLGLAATVLVCAHATVDFSLQIPGLAVIYALLAGMAWGQSWPTRRSHSKEP
jgi:O-antigen ligase